ncbi:MAG: dUTP diphosphatase [Acidobacteriota bacterium]|nr:dUTP diphosphatase [Acidobacteriota bacterium]
MQIPIVTLPHFEGLPLPAYETSGSVGMDLRAALTEPLVLQPGQRRAAPTGIRIAIPVGFEGQVRPRSGLSLKLGIGVVNSPGTIDADYRGEILVPLINFATEEVTIERGMRIAQLIIAPVRRASWQKVDELPDTQRGAGGFGHTGSH